KLRAVIMNQNAPQRRNGLDEPPQTLALQFFVESKDAEVDRQVERHLPVFHKEKPVPGVPVLHRVMPVPGRNGLNDCLTARPDRAHDPVSPPSGGILLSAYRWMKRSATIARTSKSPVTIICV